MRTENANIDYRFICTKCVCIDRHTHCVTKEEEKKAHTLTF